MRTCTVRMIKKNTYLLPLIFAGSIVSATTHTFSTTPSIINSGGGSTSSASYSTRYSLGYLAGSGFNSISYQIQTDTLSIPDNDNDNVLDNTDNCLMLSNADQINTDGDLFGNACDADDDNDGLSDIDEATLGTNPLLADTDSDGLNDGVDPNPLIGNADGDLAPYGAPDGIINAADFFIAQQIVLNIITPTQNDIIHGDVYPIGSPDGIIDASDLVLIKQMTLTPSP